MAVLQISGVNLGIEIHQSRMKRTDLFRQPDIRTEKDSDLPGCKQTDRDSNQAVPTVQLFMANKASFDHNVKTLLSHSRQPH